MIDNLIYYLSIENYLSINLLIFFLGLIAITCIHRSIIYTLLLLELLLFSIISNFLVFSIFLSDPLGQIYSILLLALIAAESVIGLSLIIILFHQRGNLDILSFNLIKN